MSTISGDFIPLSLYSSATDINIQMFFSITVTCTFAVFIFGKRYKASNQASEADLTTCWNFWTHRLFLIFHAFRLSLNPIILFLRRTIRYFHHQWCRQVLPRFTKSKVACLLKLRWQVVIKLIKFYSSLNSLVLNTNNCNGLAFPRMREGFSAIKIIIFFLILIVVSS